MSYVGTLLVFLSSCVCLVILLILLKFLHKVWWTPIRIQRALRSQGINGPSYRFIHGNTKEIFKMRKESTSKPMELSSHNLFPRILPEIYLWINIYGRNYLNWYGPKARIVVTESELAKDILNNKDKAYAKTDADGFVKKLLGDGLVFSEGEKWAKVRKLANHAFHADRLKNMIPDMISSAEMMLERWKQYEGKELEVYEELRILTSEVISRTAFGSSYSEGKDIFEMVLKLAILTTRNAFKIRLPGLSKILKTADDTESDELEQGIRYSIIRIIKKREEEMTGEVDSFGTDYLGLLVKAYHDADEKHRITIEDVVDECKTFYLAGQETTATLLTWTVLLLAIHTDWQEKARQEVLELFGQEHPNSEGIGRLKMMNMIINESLRLYPPVVSSVRKAKHEVKLGKFIVPANTVLQIPPLAFHHDPQIWGEDVLLFKPERFSEGVAKATNNNPAAFLPFSFGPRICVGMNFAMNEAKIALSMILQRYSFTLSPTYIHSPVSAVTISPQHGVQVIIHTL
ncbi:cytochrome P450 CYP749A22-like isoform X2 [Cornus florida]|uniref:cytochrome P450 CYP749A22-like isoform X2 n=1 Tax=Cornus florida TaxID=4283 RepID=UPI00289E4108|nr:cytochrome P450 CYP749A22-like isoform X2 [Cornus florida]